MLSDHPNPTEVDENEDFQGNYYCHSFMDKIEITIYLGGLLYLYIYIYIFIRFYITSLQAVFCFYCFYRTKKLRPPEGLFQVHVF